jgi:hypothetical protein
VIVHGCTISACHSARVTRVVPSGFDRDRARWSSPRTDARPRVRASSDLRTPRPPPFEAIPSRPAAPLDRRRSPANGVNAGGVDPESTPGLWIGVDSERTGRLRKRVSAGAARRSVGRAFVRNSGDCSRCSMLIAGGCSAIAFTGKTPRRGRVRRRAPAAAWVPTPDNVLYISRRHDIYSRHEQTPH